MPSAGEMYPSKSNNLKAADLQGRAVKVKVSDIDVAKFDEGNKLVLKFEGREKGLVLNKTNTNIIVEKFGDDYSKWNGVEIEVYPDKTMFGSDLVDCLRVRVPVPAADDFGDDIPF